MKRLQPYLRRHEPSGPQFSTSLKSGFGAFLGIAAAGGLASLTELPFLLAPFGATAVLVFGQPASALAQPVNVIGGYAIGAATAALLMTSFPGAWLAAAIGVGVAITLMLALRLTHPPAGAIPIMAATSPLAPTALMEVVIGGSILMIALAAIHHRIPPRQHYPRPID